MLRNGMVVNFIDLLERNRHWFLSMWSAVLETGKEGSVMVTEIVTVAILDWVKLDGADRSQSVGANDHHLTLLPLVPDHKLVVPMRPAT